MSFLQSTVDTCLFKRSRRESTKYITVYEDKLLIIGKEKKELAIKNPRKEYDMKDTEVVTYYLDGNIEKTNEGNDSLNEK